jgi:hypothetical protein
MYLAFPLLVCAYGLVFVGLPAGVLYLLVRWSKGYNRRHPR